MIVIVFCQFIHRYENDDESVALVLRTFARVFDHVTVWQDTRKILFLLGFDDPRWAADHYRLADRAARPDFQATHGRTRIASFPALLAHELLPSGVVHALDLEALALESIR